MLPFQNLRNVNIAHVFVLFMFFTKQLFLFHEFPILLPFYDDFPLYSIHFKIFFASLPGENTMLNLAEFGLLIARIMSQ